MVHWARELTPIFKFSNLILEIESLWVYLSVKSWNIFCVYHNTCVLAQFTKTPNQSLLKHQAEDGTRLHGAYVSTASESRTLRVARGASMLGFSFSCFRATDTCIFLDY